LEKSKIMNEYTVKKGDYLGKIAKEFGVGLQDLLKMNPQIKNPDKIMVGDIIKVPTQQQSRLPFQDEEDYFQQREDEVKDMIEEYFGHRIAMVLLPGGRKKSGAEAKKIQQELLKMYQADTLDDNLKQQFLVGNKILTNLLYSLGGKYGSESSLERFLRKNEARPLKVQGYTVSENDYQFFADVWRKIAMEKYGYSGGEESITGSPIAIGSTKSQKIFENYFLHNIREEEIDAQVEQDDSLGQMVADQVNLALNSLPDDNPSKNRETGLQMIAQIKQMLQDPQAVGQLVEDEIQKMVAQMK